MFIRTGEIIIFQSTLPVWAATYNGAKCHTPCYDFNPRCPCGQRPGRRIITIDSNLISIHAARVGSDFDNLLPFTVKLSISIHAARVGSDTGRQQRSTEQGYFNPRCPCGQRRIRAVVKPEECKYFNPRCPCGQRLVTVKKQDLTGISIHAARVGSDYLNSRIYRRTIGFQSTLPVWAATRVLYRIMSKNTFQSTLPVWAATV